MPPSFPPAYNSSPQAFIKPCPGKWGKHPGLPQTVFLHFKFWGKKNAALGVLWCTFSFQQALHVEQSPTHTAVTTRFPLTHPSSPLQLKSGLARLSVQAIIPLITAKSQSKLETVRAIWFWLCHNIGKSGPTVLQRCEKPFLHMPPPGFGLFMPCRIDTPQYSCYSHELKCVVRPTPPPHALEFSKVPGVGTCSHHRILHAANDICFTGTQVPDPQRHR